MSYEPAAPSRTSVLLVDDHQMVIEGIKTLLKTDASVRVVAQANSGFLALRCLHEHPEISVALVDLNMPQMSGVELTRHIRAGFPAVRVLALSMFHDHASVMEVLDAGGAGYLLKNATKAELSAAIANVAAGRTHFSQEVGQTLLQHLDVPAQRRGGAQPVAELTTREREVLRLVAEEKSNQDIAAALFISERTVETHRKNILTKTSCKSVVGLIQYAIKHKLLA
ncbi:response regulator [Hymenobacter properus]|uniref:Response regulator transcription factor n=1 Tax=Hymenobacter properus TaxID=2791026 RepID=A0A931BF56_9BACT|nr:response regulator transcription factor [Hymenobacter properus]MBF9140182.1 response regulator transcription factor [Hymenobacter properus]MBR7718989.1 response regulator transcription factor [Microvirga sp. SRT04]